MIGDRRSAFRAADVLAADLCYLGRLDEGLAMLFAACEPDPERDTPPYLLRPYVHLSDVLILAGRLPDAIRIAYEGLVTARRLGVERGTGTVLACNLAEALVGTGDWERADDVLTAALRNGGTFWSHAAAHPARPAHHLAGRVRHRAGAPAGRRAGRPRTADRVDLCPPAGGAGGLAGPARRRGQRRRREPAHRPVDGYRPKPAPVVRARAAGGSRSRAAGHRPARRRHDRRQPRPERGDSCATPGGPPARPPPRPGTRAPGWPWPRRSTQPSTGHRTRTSGRPRWPPGTSSNGHTMPPTATGNTPPP